nr:uncharacterized protein LOC111424665 [Onthophagus taurus]
MSTLQDKENEQFIAQQTKLAIRRSKGHKILEDLYQSINESRHAILMEHNFVVKSVDFPEIKNPFDLYKEEELISEVDTALEKKLQQQILLCDILTKKINMKKAS